jgi:hypothetical protein
MSERAEGFKITELAQDRVKWTNVEMDSIPVSTVVVDSPDTP